VYKCKCTVVGLCLLVCLWFICILQRRYHFSSSIHSKFAQGLVFINNIYYGLNNFFYKLDFFYIISNVKLKIFLIILIVIHGYLKKKVVPQKINNTEYYLNQYMYNVHTLCGTREDIQY
jgi:hypothetical protein